MSMGGRLTMGRTLLLIGALLLFFGMAERCQEEIPMPKTLELHNNELHIHGAYRAPLGERSEISFVISVPSYFRFYMAEHEVVDMDVQLVDSHSAILVPYFAVSLTHQDLSMSVWGEEMLASKLEPGSYKVIFTPFLVNDKLDRKNTCESVTLEIAISPVAATEARIAKLPTYDATFVPPLSAETIDSYMSHGTSFSYDSTEDRNSELFNVKVVPPSEITFGPQYLTHWSFQLSPKPGTNPVYNFEASVGYNFLTSGNLRLLLDNSNSATKPACEEAEDEDLECKRGTNMIENNYVLQTKLGPGNYTLWLYALPDRKLTNIPSHPFSLQFSISQIHADESFLSCPELFLPESLNTPGLIDATGFLHYRDEVLLDLSKKSQTVTFTVPSAFLFRVWTDQHRVDIDIVLKRKDGAQIARTFRTAGQAESIIAQGEAEVQYELIFRYYGRYDSVFCESFLLELLIQPITPYYHFDYCTAASSTDKPEVYPVENTSDKYDVPRKEYHYLWNATKHHDDTLVNIPIVVSKNMVLKANIEAHFLAGLDMMLTAVTTEGVTTQRRYNHAKTYRGGMKLSYVLEAGRNYTFTVRGGPHSGMVDISSFPTCAFFAFEMSLIPAADFASIATCENKRLPTFLAGPSYFGSSNRVHFQDVLNVPPMKSPFESSDSMTFTVRQKSLFRAFTESRILKGKDIDIDFVLKEDGNLIEHEVKEEGEEKITFILKPGKTYEFTTLFFADFSLLPSCIDWNIEWEVAPIFEAEPSGSCHVKLPDTYPIVIRDIRTEFTSADFYAFEQSAETLKIRIPIEVINTNDTGETDVVYFRALITYDFVWSDLVLRLIDEDNEVVALGQNNYNINEIVSLKLASGNYTLEIVEPQALEQEEMHHCSQFFFSIGIAPHHSDQIQIAVEEEEPCPFVYFTHSWNSPAGINVLSDNTMHDARDFRKRGLSSDIVLFTLTEPSYFRAFIPPLEEFDVDIYLQQIVDETEPVTLEKGVSYHKQETLMRRLEPGNYRVVFKYYFFPEDEKCLTFPAELGIASVHFVTSFLNLPPSLCQTSAPVIPPLVTGTRTTAQYFRKTTEPYTQSIAFEVSEPSVLKATLTYTFFTGHMFFTLTGHNISSPYRSTPKDMTIYAYIGEDVSFFDHLLYPGSYVLTFDDQFTYSSNTTIPTFCTRFTFDYEFTEGAPDNYCDDADTLPTDLFSPFGGSKYFGGPQKFDGSVRISGRNFVLPKYRSHSNIAFRIREPSWFRAWAKFDKEENDVDFLLWKNKDKKVLISAAAGINSIESHSAFLNPADEPYVLDLFVYSRVAEDCRFFHFELAIETNSSILDDLVCPDPLPSPLLPPSSVVANDMSVTVWKEINVFTAEYVNAHKKHYWLYDVVDYEIAIHIPGPDDYLLFAITGYNFVLMDIEMRLLDANRTTIKRSDSEIPPVIDTFVDFESFLQTRLRPGNYTLVLSEKIYDIEKYPRVLGTCEKFSFLLGLDSLSVVDNKFRVDRVIPPEGSQLDVHQGLVIEITFTHKLGTLPSAGLLEWFKSNEVVYLSDVTDGTKLQPNMVVIQQNNAGLRVTFYPLKVAHKYELKITDQFLKDEDGQNLEPYPTVHTYSSFACDCGEHGTCISNTTQTICSCEKPYTGPECNACILGYHKSHAECVPNQQCTANYCNGHGKCTDTSGAPFCTCDIGYDSNDTNICTLCATGYVKADDGRCVKKTDGRGTRCTTPILPSTLDSVAHLGVNGRTHIQGDYYIDLTHTEHNMEFTLKKESYFRVYAEPHEIDIDLWLSRKVGETTELVKFSISFNEEETLFLRLPPAVYLLNFQFLVLKEVPGDCHSFNFEIAIAPVADFQAEVDLFKSKCSPTDNVSHLPNIVLPTIPLGPYRWDTEEIFTVAARDNEDGKPRDFWSLDFFVPRGDGASTLVFELQLGYKFLTGDLAVRLERTDVQVVDRKTGQIRNKIVGFGYNGFNTHYLKHFVQEGAYKLVLYLPTAQNKTVAPCTPFTMALSSSWRVKEEDIFSCPLAKLPPNFNSGTLADGPDVIHVIDNFLVENWSNSFIFNTLNAVTLRIDATSQIPFDFQLQKLNAEGKWDKVASDDGGELYIPELEGRSKYQVVFTYEFLDELVFCPSLDLEFMIKPKAHVKDSLTDFTCPSSHVPVVPQIPKNGRYGGSTMNYTFTGLESGKTTEQVFYAFPEFGELIDEWTFDISEDAFLDINIGSYFLSSNIRAELVSSTGRVNLRSDSISFNHNRLAAELQPDVYKLKLTQQVASGVPLVTCNPFSFSLVLRNVGQWRQFTTCEDVTVLDIPKTFNSLRYMGYDGSVKIQSDKWLVPSTTAEKILVQTQITFEIKERSLFRIYVEEHKMDIDVELHHTEADGIIKDGSTPLVTGINGFGEESFVVTLEPGHYAVQFLFWNWENDRARCLVFDMELAISPMLHLPIRPLRCTDVYQTEHLWPSLPTRIEKVDLPFQTDFDGHYQQNDLKGSLQSYNISVSFDFDIHIEIGYNFIVSDLVLQFSGADFSFTEYGSNEYTRNVYTKRNIPAGDYVITIYESTANDIDAMGCSDFEFFLFLDQAKSSVVEIEKKDSGWLPSTLNALPYLLYSYELKLHEQSFLVFSSTLSSYSKTITFDIKKPSLFHVVIDGTSNSPPPFTVNLKQGSPKTVDLLQLLPVGSYTLYLYPNENTPHLFGGSLTLANIHLSIQPYDQVQSEVNALCATSRPSWKPDQIEPRDTDGYYHYREMNARLDAKQVTVTGDLYTLPFDIDRDSIISVQTYYEFLWGDLHLMLFDKTKTQVHHGLNDYNSNDLQAFLKPGSYLLTINQPLGWPSDIDYHLPCSEFYIRISISDAASHTDRVDCSAFSIFPWDLMSPTGGSDDFGGPMSNGELRLWSDKFLMNGDGTELVSTFSLSQPSIVSLFMSQPTWNDLTAKIVKKGTSTSLATYSEHHTWYQQVSLFKTNDLSTSQYDLMLSYVPTSWTSCAQFSFGFAIAPVRDIEQQLIAACSGARQELPRTINKNIIQVSSHFSNKDLETFTTEGKGFAYNMEFSITDTTDLDVALSYDPLQSFFVLRLYTSRGGPTDTWSLFSEGTWGTASQASSTLSFSQNIDVRLDKRYPKYRLAIEQEKPLLSPKSSTQTFCYPFHFLFQLGEGDKPFVRYVEPTQGERLNPDRDFFLELRFSSKLYYSENGASPKPADRTKAVRDLLANFVFLQDIDDKAKKVTPMEAKAPEDNPQPDDGTRWMFIFSAKNLEYGKHYQLQLVPQRLFDENGVGIELRTVHNYTMAEFEKRCNGHGTFNDFTKTCVCNTAEHRTGPTCSDCDIGYHEKDGKCVRPEGCQDRTCGCGHASTPSHCEPLGVCNPSTDRAHPEAVTCSCISPKYAGAFCERCAVGYSNYPMCTKDSCNPPCEHGICKEDTNTCECKDNWAGPQCNQCAPGFTGSNCETEHGIMKVVGMIFVVLIIAGLVAFAVWYFKFRKPADGTLVSNDEILLEGIGQKNVDLDSGSDSDPSSELGSDSWEPPKTANVQEGTADADSIEISDSSDAPTGGNLL